MTITNAAFATHVSAIVRTATHEAGGLAFGMWNPNFCSADASGDALRFCNEMEHLLENIKVKAARPTPAAEGGCPTCGATSAGNGTCAD